MSENNIEFSKIHLIKDNNENTTDNSLNSNDKFQTELNKLKQKFNKLQLSTKNIINQKQFHFNDFVYNNTNIKQQKFISKSSNKTISSNTFKIEKFNINNNADSNNIVLTNIEKDINSYNNIDSNLNNTISLIQYSFSQNENTNSINKENNNNNNNNKSFPSYNNLFVVKTSESNKTKSNLLGNKTNKKERKNKKENLINEIIIEYNNLKNIVDNYRNYFKIIDKNKDIKTIVMDDKNIFDIYLNKGVIKKVYSYQNNIFSKKPKDIIEQLKNIHNTFETKLISLGLINNNDS